MALNYNAAVNISATYSGQPTIQRAARDIAGLDRNVRTLRGGMSTLTTGFKALAGAYLVREAVQFSRSIINIGDQMLELSQKTGIGANTLSSLKTAAELGGVEIGQLESTLRKFTVTTGEAIRGSEKSRKGFQDLGISVRDASGGIKSGDVLLGEVADKFSKMQDGAEKAAIATKLFGKTGVDLIPVLNEGSEALTKYGLKFGDDFAKNADAFNDSITLLGVTVQQFMIDKLGPLLPTMRQIVDALREFGTASKEATGDSEFLKSAIKGVVLVAVGLTEAFINGADLIKTLLMDIGQFLSGWFASQVDRVQTFGKQIVAIAKLNFDEVGRLQDEFNARTIAGAQGSVSEHEKAWAGFADRNSARLESVKKLYDDLYNKPPPAVPDLPNRTAGSGFGEGVDSPNSSLEERAEDATAIVDKNAKQMQGMLTNAFRAAEDSFVSFVRTGKLEFKDLADSVVSDLARMAFKNAAAGVVSSIFGGGAAVGFAMGGVMTADGPMPLNRYASGGVARSPQMAMFGEGSRPEAFVPLPDGRNIPVKMQGAGTGGTSVVVNVNISGGDTEQSTESQNKEGREIGNAISMAVQAELVKQKRPGGLLA